MNATSHHTICIYVGWSACVSAHVYVLGCTIDFKLNIFFFHRIGVEMSVLRWKIVYSKASVRSSFHFFDDFWSNFEGKVWNNLSFLSKLASKYQSEISSHTKLTQHDWILHRLLKPSNLISIVQPNVCMYAYYMYVHQFKIWNAQKKAAIEHDVVSISLLARQEEKEQQFSKSCSLCATPYYTKRFTLDRYEFHYCCIFYNLYCVCRLKWLEYGWQKGIWNLLC